jgi:hypothetical protein
VDWFGGQWFVGNWFSGEFSADNSGGVTIGAPTLSGTGSVGSESQSPPVTQGSLSRGGNFGAVVYRNRPPEIYRRKISGAGEIAFAAAFAGAGGNEKGIDWLDVEDEEIAVAMFMV